MAEEGRMSLKPNEDLSGLNRRELCEFASELCAKIEAEVGQMTYRGGIYEGNVSVDENGEIRLGPPAEGEPSEQELLYAAPELYWHGKYTPACDVYSIGLLLYKLAEGRLPFESENCDEKRAHRLRLQGSSFNHPLNAGRRLGDIIVKALSYDPSDRYRNPGEMKIMLDNCLKNLFLREEPCAEAVFLKSDDDLSEMERMMVSIIETHSDFDENAAEGKVDEAAAVVGPIFGEEEESQELMGTEPAEETVRLPEEAEEETEQMEIPPEVPDGFDPEPEGEEEEFLPVREGTEETAEEESREGPEQSVRDAVVRLEPAQADPELEPVHVKGKKNEDFPDIIVTNTGKTVSLSQKQVEAEVRRRKRRPLIFILVLCALLVFAALLFNKIMGPAPAIPEPEETEDIPGPVVVTSAPVVETPEPEPSAPAEMISEYRFFSENVSWSEARERCAEEGGHLVVINDADEFAKVTGMAEERGIHVIWIGLHRESGMLVWETDDLNAEFFYNWDQGEPSEFDGDIREDYVFIWDWTGRGWVYNDCINDPEGEDPESYRNQIGFVCEIEKPKE